MIVLSLDVGMKTGAALAEFSDKEVRLLFAATVSTNQIPEFVDRVTQRAKRIDQILVERPIPNKLTSHRSEVEEAMRLWDDWIRQPGVRIIPVRPSDWKPVPLPDPSKVWPSKLTQHTKDAISILMWYHRYVWQGRGEN